MIYEDKKISLLINEGEEGGDETPEATTEKPAEEKEEE